MSDEAAWSDRIVEWARRFHVEYEYQAKRFGWQSQTPVDFDSLPEANKQTMLNTVAAVMGSEVYPREREIESLRAELAALREPESVVSPDHVLKVELGEFTNYTLVCNLDDAAGCHQTCVTHPEGGCGDFDAEEECVTKVYEYGCTVAEWVNDGGIEAVEFSHTLELPVKIEWRASHDYPSLHVPPTSPDDRVEKLEWDEPIGLTGIIMTAGPWEVYRRQDGECLLMIRSALVAEGLTVDAAKALAERLQAVLSSPTSPDPTRELERLRKLESKVAGLVRTAYVPESGEIKVVRQWWDSLVTALGNNLHL